MGRLSKRKRNITGLRNQPRTAPELESTEKTPISPEPLPTNDLDQVVDGSGTQEPLMKFAQWFGYKDAKEEDKEEEYEEEKWEDEWFENKELEKQMLRYAAAMESSTQDESDWGESAQVAKKARRQQREKKGAYPV
jgi:hypothetical protein